MIKRLFCKHEYKLANTYKKSDLSLDSINYKEICILYCPKCNKKLEVNETQHDTIMSIQEIRAKYELIENTNKLINDVKR